MNGTDTNLTFNRLGKHLEGEGRSILRISFGLQNLISILPFVVLKQNSSVLSFIAHFCVFLLCKPFPV